jgi:hypothetical protein
VKVWRGEREAPANRPLSHLQSGEPMLSAVSPVEGIVDGVRIELAAVADPLEPLVRPPLAHHCSCVVYKFPFGYLATPSECTRPADRAR